MSEGQTFHIRYLVERDQERKTFRLILSIPLAPLWRALEEFLKESGKGEAERRTLDLFLDPQMIKHMYADIDQLEKEGYTHLGQPSSR